MKIRSLSKQDDRLAVSHVYEASWKAAYRGMIPQMYLDTIPAGKWAACLDTEGWDSLLLLDQAKIVGTCAFASARHPEMQGCGEIIALYLLPAYWGQGHGYRLLNKAIHTLYAKGFERIYLWVLEENHRARQFYETFGFRASGAVLEDTIGGKPVREVQYIYQYRSDTDQEELS